MPEFCTCGTKLVEDARFCHRCGRPTIAPVEEEPPPPQITTQPSFQAKLAQIPVGFNNPVAFRVALLMSVAIIPVELAPILSMLSIVWWLAAGWCAVLLYRRLTGTVLTVRAGARLGSITGVLTFVVLAIGFTIAMVFAGKELLDEMVRQNPQAAQMIRDPVKMSVGILFLMAVLFTIVVSICAAGGALGARYSGRKNRTV